MYLSDTQRIERALPARLMYWICDQMVKCHDGDAETLRLFRRSFDAVVDNCFIDVTDHAKRQKLARRLHRAVNTVEVECVGLGMENILIVTRIVVQHAWNSGRYEPCELFLETWGRFTDAVYSICGNGAALNAADRSATELGQRAIDRLMAEGYYSDRNIMREAA